MNHKETAQREDWFSWPGIEQGKDYSVLHGISMQIMLNVLWIWFLAFTGKKVNSVRKRESVSSATLLSHFSVFVFVLVMRVWFIRSSPFLGPGPETQHQPRQQLFTATSYFSSPPTFSDSGTNLWVMSQVMSLWKGCRIHLFYLLETRHFLWIFSPTRTHSTLKVLWQ